MKIEWISLRFLRYTLSRGKLLWVFVKTPYFKVSLGAFPLLSHPFYAILRLDINKPEQFEQFVSWIRENFIRVLNIAGPRESQSQGIYEAAFTLIQRLFSLVMVNRKSCCAIL